MADKISNGMTYGKRFWYAGICSKCGEVFWSETGFDSIPCPCGGEVPKGVRVDDKELERIKETGKIE